MVARRAVGSDPTVTQGPDNVGIVTAPGLPTPPGETRPIAVPAPAALVVFGFLAVGALVGSVLGGAVVAFGGSTTGAGTTLLSEVGLWSGMSGAAVYLSRRYGTSSLRRDLGFAITHHDVGPGLVALAAGLLATQVVTLAFDGTRYSGTNTQLISNQHGFALALLAVIVAIGAPVFEELYFRGALRTALGRRLGGHLAVVVQAVIFGLSHYLPGNGVKNVSVMVIVGTLGLVLGYTARATGRLGPGMLAHGMFNLIALAVTI